jgi:hypothetical protein
MDPNKILLQWYIHLVLMHRIAITLTSTSCCENEEINTYIFVNYFVQSVSVYSLKFFIKSNYYGSKSNFETSLNAQYLRIVFEEV